MGGDDPVIPSRVAVIGLGASGTSAWQALHDRGCEVCVFDQRAPSGTHGAIRVVANPDQTELANAILAWSPEVVVTSPGVPATSSLLRTITAAGIPLWGEVELAWRLQEAGPGRGRPWLCVTGTNGKTTTVGILTAILAAAGEKVAEVGNVGLPITSQIDSAATVFAVEVSSFQLETALSLEPEASLCLNIDADHLDWHGTADAYRLAKGRVFDGAQRARVFFEGDAVVASLAHDAVRTTAPLLGLSRSTPQSGQIGISGETIVDGADGTVLAILGEIPFLVQRNYSSALLDDVLAAVALARVHGVGPQAIQRGLRGFTLDAHRQALVSEADQVRWIDDSKATNAHAAQAALRDVPAGTAIWIAGGDPKGQDFDSLVASVADRLRAAVLIGVDRGPLKEAFARQAPGVPLIEVHGEGTPAQWMATVVQAAAQRAQTGDSVVLAPACASWDQFDNYSQRGEVFSEAVNNLLGGTS